MRKCFKVLIFVFLGLVVAIALVLGVAFSVLAVKSNSLNDDYFAIYSDPKYLSPVKVEGVNVITQDISCGYAVIEMFSSWQSGSITEESLFEKYGGVVTSTGSSFCDEFNKQFPAYHTQMYSYLKNTELIDKVYSCLTSGVPVPFEWAAKYGNDWTLHYSLITGLDIAGDMVTIANPYGYMENISISEFLDRTSFRAFENMPLYYNLAFAFGIFEKNAIFIPTLKI